VSGPQLRFIYVLVCLCLWPIGAHGAATSWHAGWAYGPLTLTSRAPVYDQRLSFATGRVPTLQAKRSDITVGLSHVNTWAQMRGYFFDGEFSRLNVRLAYGVTGRTEVALHLGILRQSGGFLDGFIEGFHALAHVTQSRRDLYPRNTLKVATLRDGQETVRLSNAQTGSGLLHPVVVARYSLMPADSPWLLVGEVHGQIPLGQGRGRLGAPGLNGLLNVTLAISLRPWLHFYTAPGVMLAVGSGSLYGMPLASINKMLMVGLEARIARRASLVFHYLNQDGIVEDAHYLPMHLSTHEFVLGVKWQPFRRLPALWELGIIENSVHDANTPDFGATLAIRVLTG
jgi:hypothetical protein